MRIKTLLSAIVIFVTGLVSTPSVSAQYYEIANRLPQLLSPALSGSGRYKGFIEAGYDRTLGKYNADFFEFNTSQGYSYASWFYMGVGLGVDVISAHHDNQWGTGWESNSGFNTNHSSTKTAVMMPLFTDFRATLGSPTSTSFFIDLKLGCSFLLSKKYIEIGNGYL
ncbi:MAG: hypothetical protein K2H60_08790, partial [Muribaculaceae bacterium]|nr:hypothetical protein [Muribaculaceae bacterium]